MNEQQRQNMMIAFLVVLTPFAVWHVLEPALSRAAGGFELHAPGRGTVDVASQQMVELRADRIERAVGGYSLERNLFQFYAPAKPVNRGNAGSSEQQAAFSAGERNQKIRSSEPQPPSIDVVLLGIFGPERRRIAAFATGDEVLNVLEKQTLGNKFIVHRIGLQSVDLTFIGFPDAPSVRMTIGGAQAGHPQAGHPQAAAPVRGVS